MASFLGEGVCAMSKPNTSATSVAVGHRLRPVRVKVFRADGKITRVHPPDGESAIWWERLKKALGTTSSDFVNASLFQIQSACRSPWGGISQLAMNAALAMIEAAHTAAMAVLAKLDVVFATEQRVTAFGSAAARLMKARDASVEKLPFTSHTADNLCSHPRTDRRPQVPLGRPRNGTGGHRDVPRSWSTRRRGVATMTWGQRHDTATTTAVFDTVTINRPASPPSQPSVMAQTSP
jgi:hypothetical protein